MTQSDAIGYYAERAAKARSLADRAPSSMVRAIHLDMAERYTLLSTQQDVGRPVLTLIAGGRQDICQVAAGSRSRTSNPPRSSLSSSATVPS